MLQFVDWLQTIYPIDKRRMFIWGHSNGGFMSSWFGTTSGRHSGASTQPRATDSYARECTIDQGPQPTTTIGRKTWSRVGMRVLHQSIAGLGRPSPSRPSLARPVDLSGCLHHEIQSEPAT
ncbi:MAG TPA: prolyl oligopeptidase family serine peptidase [Planctomycetota bacterium]|nr:prolyl oligopeptidase family serine peptidase [Planctomycetota bacterium]